MSERLTGDVEHDLPILMEAVCRYADAYLDCLNEFEETAAGDLSAGACGERRDQLQAAVHRWLGAQAVVDIRRQWRDR